ncbi:MAG: class I SAM-dependent methyltransferase [Actinomycetales bacterium]
MTEHYFSEQPTGPDQRRLVEITLDGQQVRLQTARGVFSGDRLDLGTAVLLKETPAPQGRELLDLGCGYGPIALTMARRNREARVWAVDVNARARELTAANAAALGLAERVVVAAPAELPTTVELDELWSNPPIRIGKAALHELLLTWLPRLRAEGVARLVVARNLGADSLAAWLTDQGYRVTRTASSKGYRVLEVRKAGALFGVGPEEAPLRTTPVEDQA